MKTLYKILIAVAVFIIGFTIYQKCQPEYIEDKTETTTDLQTKIDSLQAIVTYYESIPPAKRDTVKDTVYIEKPISVDSSTNLYNTTYSDSTLDAWITSKVTANKFGSDYKGVLVDQIFTYSIKRQKVKEINNTIKVNTLKTVTTTRTLVKNPKPFFTIGAELGPQTVGPIIGYSKPGQFNIFYRYDLNHNAHSIGFQLPIKF